MTHKFNPLNGKPAWLEEGRDLSHVSKSNMSNYLRSLKYYRQLYKATPPWYDEEMHARTLALYHERDRRRARGENVVIDHVIPVCSDVVSGLNVPWNLELITEKANAKKSNLYWPDMPNEQTELFEVEPEPQQLRLV